MKRPCRFLSVLSAILATAVGLQLRSTVCRGEDVAQLQAEIGRFQQQINAGNYEQAERQAQYILGLAERVLRDQPKILAATYSVMGSLYYDQDKFREAEPLFARAVKLQAAATGAQSAEVAKLLHQQADAVYYQDDYKRAAGIYRQALEIRQKALGNRHLDTAQSWRELGYTFYMASEYDKAAQCYDQVIAIRQRLLGENDALVAGALNELADVRYYQLRYPEALTLYNRALAIRKKVDGPRSVKVASYLADRADCLHSMFRYTEAEADWREALDIREELVGPDSIDAAAALRGLGWELIDLARYDEADACFKRALAIDERESGASHGTVASSLLAMGQIRMSQGRHAEAEPLMRRALAIRERAQPPTPLPLATVCSFLSSLYMDMGRYAESEAMQRRALALREQNLGEDDPDVATSLNNLGAVLKSQGRDRDAEPLYRRALDIRLKKLAPNDPFLATSMQNLANLESSLGNYAEAESLYNRALEIYKKVYGEDHREVADCLSCLADMYWNQDKKVEAQQLYEQSFAMIQKHLGQAHPDLARYIYDLAWCYFFGDEEKRAEELLDRAADIDRQFPLNPQTAYNIYFLRARVNRFFERKSEAFRDLERAMQLAEQLRGSSSGAELERADFFAGFSRAFEVMVEWQFEDGADVEKALDAIERSRARSLLDEIGLLGADLEAGRPVIEEEQLRQTSLELRSQLTQLEQQLQELLQSENPSDTERRRLNEEIAAVREKLYQQFRDARSSSVIYQNLLNRSAKMPSLGEIQRHLLDDQGLMFVYLMGSQGGYLIELGSEKADLYSLQIGEEDAKILGCEAGPLSAESLKQILLGDRGVMQGLATPQPPAELTARLHALWQVLVPESSRTELLQGKCGRLIVVPNGPLALLPFEALVTSADGEPAYLLDRGPPILYAPSVTVLDSLRIRASAPPPADRQPVLSVGDPKYRDEPPSEQGARSALARARLTALPFSGLESKWVAEVFGKEGLPAAQLLGEEATEAKVRAAAAARRVLHLACHGLTDQAHGNLFGALALASGENPDQPDDDGFLSLAEIYDLNLRGCELAILSACETNYGPEQEGEGIWTLSRGFLVAGSRRVVASNWVVDDEAAASLVSYFCAGVAKAEKSGDARAYGKALLEAKRYIRSRDPWKAPYYWASMVLIGPP